MALVSYLVACHRHQSELINRLESPDFLELPFESVPSHVRMLLADKRKAVLELGNSCQSRRYPHKFLNTSQCLL